MNVCLYARVSTKDHNQDTTNQLHQLREFCQRSGWSVVREYVDNKSGKSGNRPEFQAMFEAARRREFDLVLFWSLDRLSREGVSATLKYLEQLDSCGVGWKSYTEQYLDSTGIFRDAVIAILAVVAKQERVRLSERVIAGLQTARRKGKVLGRPRVCVDRYNVRAMRANGMSLNDIAVTVGKSRSTIARIARAAAAAPDVVKTP